MSDNELEADMKDLAESTRKGYLDMADRAYGCGMIGKKEYDNFRKAVELGFADPEIADDIDRLKKKVDLDMFNSTMNVLSQL
jgi:hypothetical protein